MSFVFNMTGGGGGSGGTLVVTAPVGVTVTATKGDKTYTRIVNAEGKATFRGLSSGTWMLSIDDATHEPSTPVPVEIKADYTVTLTFFSATINITYPATSNCVVTDSSGETVASDSNTGRSAKTWTATVTAAGTYTVTATATDGSGNTISSNVSITTDGQSASLTLSYILYLYYRGDLQEVNSGGWGAISNLVQFNADHIFLNGTGAYQVFIHDRVSIPDRFNKLVVVGEVVSQTNNTCFQNCGLVSTSDLSNGDVAAVWNQSTLGAFTKTIDISSVTDRSARVVKIGVGLSDLCDGKIYEVYVTS